MYDLKIGRSTGGTNYSIVTGKIFDAVTGDPISKAEVIIRQGGEPKGSYSSEDDGKYNIIIEWGSCHATVNKAGYKEESADDIRLKEGGTVTKNFFLTPCQADKDSDGDGIGDCDDGCPDDPNKSEPGACGCNMAESQNCGNTPQTDDGGGGGGGGGGCFIYEACH